MGNPIRTPAQAVAWTAAQKTWTPHSCENFTKNAYYGPDVQTADGAQDIALPTALASWNAHPEWQVTDGSEPPVGACMFFDGVPGDTAGDRQIYIGNHLTRRTDVGTWGTVGTVDWKWMETVVGHRYLGWKRDVDGYLMFPAGTQTASTGTETVLNIPTAATLTQEAIMRTFLISDGKNQEYALYIPGRTSLLAPVSQPTVSAVNHAFALSAVVKITPAQAQLISNALAGHTS